MFLSRTSLTSTKKHPNAHPSQLPSPSQTIISKSNAAASHPISNRPIEWDLSQCHVSCLFQHRRAVLLACSISSAHAATPAHPASRFCGPVPAGTRRSTTRTTAVLRATSNVQLPNYLAGPAQRRHPVFRHSCGVAEPAGVGYGETDRIHECFLGRSRTLYRQKYKFLEVYIDFYISFFIAFD